MDIMVRAWFARSWNAHPLPIPWPLIEIMYRYFETSKIEDLTHHSQDTKLGVQVFHGGKLLK